MDVAARVSTGRAWPDDPSSGTKPGGVVLLSAEDDLGDTIKPRLEAFGADTTRIRAIEAARRPDPTAGGTRERPFNLAKDMDQLEKTIQDTPDCRLVIIDPISAYLGATDSHGNAAVRALLAPLSGLAAKYRVAVLVISHLRKGAGPAMYRAMGSLAYIATVRTAFALARDKGDPTGQRKLLLPIKNNIGSDRGGLAFRLVAPEGKEIPALVWDPEPVYLDIDEALRPKRGPGKNGEQETAIAEAKEWLDDALADGPVVNTELFDRAAGDGISKATLRRAKKALNVESSRKGYGAAGTWWWVKPTSAKNAEGDPNDQEGAEADS